MRRCGREKHLNKHIIRLDVVTVVFLGGCVGTGLRYASSSIADVGGFHVGTFAANMVACFVYAALSAWLGSSSLLKGRAKIRESWIRHGHVRRPFHHVHARIGRIHDD